MGQSLKQVASALQGITQRVWPRTLWPRLLILLLAATGPLLALLLVSAVEDGELVLQNGRDQALQLARLGAEQQDDVLQEAVGLLQVLARVADMRQVGPRCGELLRSVVSDHPRIEGIAVAGADGVITCGSRPGRAGLDVSDRPYFLEAMQPRAAGHYVLSSLTVSRITGQPTLFVAVPMPPLLPGEAQSGVLIASLGLDWFARVRTHAPGISNQAYQVMDSRDGALLARSPDPAGRVGQRFPEHPLMQAFAQSPRGGSVMALDFDGVTRVFGFAPLPGRDAGPFLAVGLAETELRAQADQRFWFAVSLVLVALGVAVSTAWLVAQRALLHPIKALAVAATALGAGNLSARADIGRGAAQELRNLGATFTRMGRRLRDRDTELDGMQVQLSASEEHHRLLADASNDIITRFDREFRRVYVSQACRELLGYTPDELAGSLPGGLVHPEDAAGLAAAFTQPLQAGAPMARASYRSCRKDGQYVWLESNGRRLADGSGYVVVTRDVSERKLLEGRLEDANRQLRILVRQDGLTGLANRRRFDEALGDEYRRASRGRHSLALFMVDVDRFKPFNDTYGHPAGDSCLQAVAGVLESVPRRGGDLAARYGGEEFVILMAETDAAGAAAVAERLCKAVRDLGIPHRHGLGGIVTVSVGVAVVQPGPDHAGPAGLVEAADAALYTAKAEGRDRVCLSHGVSQPM